MSRVNQKGTTNQLKFWQIPLVFIWAVSRLGLFPIFIFKSLLKAIYSLLIYIKEAFVVVIRAYSRRKAQRATFQQISKPAAKPAKAGHTFRFHHKKRGRPRKLKSFFRKLIPTPLRVGIAMVFLGAGFFVYSLFLVNLAHDLPSPSQLNTDNGPITTEFYDRNGTLLYRLYEDKNRTLVKLSGLPSNLINATVAIEDKNYWNHKGVDFVGIARALISDYKSNSEAQGGSTITQQLIKNTLLTPDRTWQRKAKEVFLAFWAERIFNKQQILEMYFNEVGYGGTSVGIEAASETYFGKHTRDLDLAESAYLAGLPASPTTYSPFGNHPEYGSQREAEVLRRMVEDKYINQDQMNLALSEKLQFKQPEAIIKAPHFVMYVRSLLAEKYGERIVSQGGLKVYTSLDLPTQQMAEQVVKEEVNKLASLNVTNGAAIIEDPRNGEILAMVGSKDYYDPTDGNFNVALADRQPGSSIKPITYAAAFKQGYSPGTTVLDAQTTFVNPWGISYSPVNYDGKFHGLVTMRTALGSSFNIPAVKTLQMVGIPNMLQTAHDMGITTLNDTGQYGLSLTLGAGEVRLIDMMTVYSTLSQMGVKHDTNPILKLTDSKGDVIEDNGTLAGTKVLDSGIAYMITNVLSDDAARTPAFGPHSLLYIPGHTVAVKTGTTDDKRDNWTYGYTPDVAVGVWVGNDDNTPMNPALTSGITGAAPIWNRLMNNLLSGKPDESFQMPGDVAFGMVDGHRDLVLVNSPDKNVAGISPTPGILSLTQPFSFTDSDQSGQVKQ